VGEGRGRQAANKMDYNKMKEKGEKNRKGYKFGKRQNLKV
jgi:hypothetical protein